MTKYIVRIINDIHDVRIYTSNAPTAESAEYEARMLYKFNNCSGNITKVTVTERRG